MKVINVYKFSYTNIKTAENWVATILATDREDAESLLKTNIPFVFSIQSVETLGKIDAVGVGVYNLFYESCVEKYKSSLNNSNEILSNEHIEKVQPTPKKSEKKPLKRKKG